MKKIYIPAEHDGLSWREVCCRASTWYEIMAPVIFMYLWGTAALCSKVIVDCPQTLNWAGYYVIVIWGGLANLAYWWILLKQEQAKKIY